MEVGCTASRIVLSLIEVTPHWASYSVLPQLPAMAFSRRRAKESSRSFHSPDSAMPCCSCPRDPALDRAFLFRLARGGIGRHNAPHDPCFYRVAPERHAISDNFCPTKWCGRKSKTIERTTHNEETYFGRHINHCCLNSRLLLPVANANGIAIPERRRAALRPSQSQCPAVQLLRHQGHRHSPCCESAGKSL